MPRLWRAVALSFMLKFIVIYRYWSTVERRDIFSRHPFPWLSHPWTNQPILLRLHLGSIGFHLLLDFYNVPSFSINSHLIRSVCCNKNSPFAAASSSRLWLQHLNHCLHLAWVIVCIATICFQYHYHAVRFVYLHMVLNLLIHPTIIGWATSHHL